MNALTEPLQYEFFRNGLMAATIIGALCGLLGVYITLRKMSYIGHGLSHSVFGGAVVSFLMGINFYIGAGLWGFLSAVLINRAARKHTIGADAAIGIITTASFALGVALISRTRSFTRDFEAALFGNILGVTRQDIFIITGVSLAVMVAVFLAYKPLLFATFDPDNANIYGVPTNWVETGFALAIAAAIVASLNVVGATLIAATIAIPPTTARLITDSFGKMVILSTLIGAACGFSGMFFSYWFDVASGASIVLLSTVVFVAVLAVTSLRKALRNRTAPAAVPATVPAASAAD
jgi:ABC-type Mn2+/Zn2+ transport system permease subunit